MDLFEISCFLRVEFTHFKGATGTRPVPDRIETWLFGRARIQSCREAAINSFYSTTIAGAVAAKLSYPELVVMLAGTVPPVLTENAVLE